MVAWNEQLLRIAEAEDGFFTLKGVRTAAMMHIAMHDALSNINGRYTSYAYDRIDSDANPQAAATQAAFIVAVDQYPDQRATLEAEREKWLAEASHNSARAAGEELGEAAARAVLRERENDGWNNEAKYQWHPMGPGVYAEFREHSGTPEGFVFGAGWAAARPFVLASHDQFRSPPPPAIESPEYTRAYDEVKDVGRFRSTSRTKDQTHLALWWKDFAESSHNRLARDLAVKHQLELAEAARLFALLNMSIFDAYVNVFDNKFFYNHWRPYTAIRWADNDGNPNTDPDSQWTNTHKHTYAFPSYPSAHGTACAAAMTVLADTFGNEFAFTMKTAVVDSAGPGSRKLEMKPPTRQFHSFPAAAMECSMSRVYLGIHFRYDSIEGNKLGSRIGGYIVDNTAKRAAK
ncbi:MAG: vanadium-dependent haloperoxidase [Pseudomonadales bacterium]